MQKTETKKPHNIQTPQTKLLSIMISISAKLNSSFQLSKLLL